MSYSIIIPEEVYEELNEAANYYEDQQDYLGVKFIDDWVFTTELLKKAPLIYQIRFKEFRAIKFTKFPYILVFEIEGNEIIIYRLIHSKRNPKKWFKR